MDIRFSFNLDKNVPTGPANTSYKLGFIEGELNIYVDERLFFSNPYVNLAELGIQLGAWLQKIKSDKKENMDYETIDHNEDILNFIYEGNDNWRVYSIWQEVEINNYISTSILETAIKHFLEDLNQELHNINYVVTLDEFLL